MTTNDWIGLGTSVGLHALLLLFFVFTNVDYSTPRDQLGYVEVEFGPLAEGRPVQEATDPDVVDEPEEPDPQPRPEPEPQELEPRPQPDLDDTSPVDLPDQVQTPELEQIPVDEAEDTGQQPQAEEEVVAAGTAQGDPEGDTGEEEGEDGEGVNEEASAPFDIEGLDRTMVYNELPDYQRGQRNVTIRIQITVDPQGDVVRAFPLMRGDPDLERAATSALLRWRFDRLPPNAPQENQRGVVTFRYRPE